MQQVMVTEFCLKKNGLHKIPLVLEYMHENSAHTLLGVSKSAATWIKTFIWILEQHYVVFFHYIYILWFIDLLWGE